MSESPSVILVAVDESESARQVVARAAALARSMPGAELHLLHVVTMIEAAPAPLRIPSMVAETLAAARELLLAVGEVARELFPGRIVAHLAGGQAWREIVLSAARLDADLIVVGTHGRSGVSRFVLGSVADQVTRRATCPVLVVREKHHAADEAAPGAERDSSAIPHGFATGSIVIRP